MDSGEEMYSDPNSNVESDEITTKIEYTNLTHENEVEHYPFKVLSTNEIVQNMADCIKKVTTVVGLPATTARILLNHCKWDEVKMFEQLYDGNQGKLFKEAHVVNPFKSSTNEASESFEKWRSTNETKDCQFCFESLAAPLITGLDCGHRFCTSCWDEYLTTKIMENSIDQTISCPAQNCKILVDYGSAMHLIKSPEIKLKYQYLITNSFVECNRLLRWCPSPGCKNAIKVEFVESRCVTCTCGHTFCFFCGENCHDPVKCELLEKWLKKCNEDLPSYKWIAENTKECPMCSFPVQRDKDCIQLTCGNESCAYEFCWVCLGNWFSHNIFSTHCDRSPESADRKERASLDNSFWFYCNRYMNHKRALESKQKFYASVREKREKFYKDLKSGSDCVFLKDAVDNLCLCRQTLMYSCVLSYYLLENNKSLIFNNNQQELESQTELLSEYLERDVTRENVANVKQEIEKKSTLCSRKREELIKYAHEGYEQEWWKFR
ncbi:potential E3 ubiquitin-protein ligase ariadne-1-like [Belonocnema kinseyi]|uniref:potential E3 ubiquitin-protein ligase ariadne-1-like n=1 Tax=Belonocnema kinseyi TaxID=2817044 RepID=UPI00143D1372|nr:potential E3 ubiquitin-protein ligase ariadne-1-like [Belonocnema kinseyi]XP_033215796.1 potential E3 ubiquitin-protein ligase ariadne-1-like [Belonocnema kinseyi]